MSAAARLALLTRLAALKAQRALADLAHARAEAAAVAEAIAAADRSSREETFAPPGDGATLAVQWRRREALAAEAYALLPALELRRAEEAGAAAAAAAACARELGAKLLAERAGREARMAEARRAERGAGVLAALRGPGPVGGSGSV
jgi:hypothetical protein